MIACKTCLSSTAKLHVEWYTLHSSRSNSSSELLFIYMFTVFYVIIKMHATVQKLSTQSFGHPVNVHLHAQYKRKSFHGKFIP